MEKADRESPLELNLGLIQGDFLYYWSFSAKMGHILQGVLKASVKVRMIKMYLGYSQS